MSHRPPIATGSRTNPVQIHFFNKNGTIDGSDNVNAAFDDEGVLHVRYELSVEPDLVQLQSLDGKLLIRERFLTPTRGRADLYYTVMISQTIFLALYHLVPWIPELKVILFSSMGLEMVPQFWTTLEHIIHFAYWCGIGMLGFLLFSVVATGRSPTCGRCGSRRRFMVGA